MHGVRTHTQMQTFSSTHIHTHTHLCSSLLVVCGFVRFGTVWGVLERLVQSVCRALETTVRIWASCNSKSITPSHRWKHTLLSNQNCLKLTARLFIFRLCSDKHLQYSTMWCEWLHCLPVCESVCECIMTVSESLVWHLHRAQYITLPLHSLSVLGAKRLFSPVI